LPHLDRRDYDSGMREYRYTVDRDGRIFHEGSEITDGAVLRSFLLAMQTSADGRYVAMCQGERNDFDASDTPFVVQRLRVAGDGTAIELFFAGDYHEPLDPSTLEEEDGRLYCRVRRTAFRARFGRLALLQLGAYMGEGDAGLEVHLGGASYPIQRAPTASPG
jgi:hypothetical protein